MSEPRSASRILIADDDVQICRLIQEVLQPEGYEIDISHDGGDFLQRYRPGNYSLLIMDTLLVPGTGLEVIMTLRDRGDRVPIILMFGPRKEPDRVEQIAFTYRVDLLRKPFGVGELRNAVARALGELSH